MSDPAKTWQDMTVPARAFLGLVVVVGLSILIYGGLHWSNRDPDQTLCYLLVALIACRMKVKLPGITGTMSAGFLVILLAIVKLDLSVLRGHPKTGQRWSGQNRPTERPGTQLFYPAAS